MERDKLMKRLMICDFILNETALYLDTHPNNRKALEYFNKYKKMYDETRAEFVSKFGPVTIFDNSSDSNWEWSTTSWPWEVE